MKKDWEYKKLGEVCCKIKNVKWKDCPNKNYQYIDLTAVDRETLRILETVSINAENAPSRAKQIVNEGDVIFATTRPTLRRFSIIPHNYNKSLCSTGFCVLRPNNDLLSKWIFYNFYTNSFYKYIEPLQNGANYPAITDSCVKDYIIPIPPLSEQKEIVEYLDSSFAKIDKLKANAAKNLEEAKALFQSALKDALEPKEGWECRTIGEVCKLKSGNSKANKSPVGDLPYVKVADMNIKGNDTFIKHSSTYVDRAYNSKDIIPCNSVIFPKRGGAILTNKKRITECEICCDLNIMAVIPNEQILPKYLYFYFVGLDFSKLFNGATIPQINNCDIAPLQIPVSSISEQQSIVSFLDSLNEKVNTLQQNYSRICDECDALKQAILRQVFE